MALKKFSCTRCEKEFKAGDWNCPDGKKHVVEEKTYYSLAANWRTYVTEDRVIDLGDGRKRLIPARQIQFFKGTYRTSDPEDQYALDEHPGLVSAEQWQEKFIDEKERLDMKKRDLERREERVRQMENQLLEQTKAAKGAK